MAELCGILLNELLWNLPYGLRNDDQSILFEEQILKVTTMLLDALSTYESPMMSHKTKVSVIYALRSTVTFLEQLQVNNDFINIFKIYFDNTIINYLKDNVEQCDLPSVKSIIQNIYKPILSHQS